MKSDGDISKFDTRLLTEGALAARHICLTIKNYNQDKGFSFRPFDQDSNFGDFEVFGPVGKGLNVNNDAVCIAYAGGTGVLTFLDLVGAIARYNLGLIAKQRGTLPGRMQRTTSEYQAPVELGEIGDNFKFIFYVSFASREDALGLELCESLHKFCIDNDLDNFELVVRLSKGSAVKPSRWDASFIENSLRKQSDKSGSHFK